MTADHSKHVVVTQANAAKKYWRSVLRIQTQFSVFYVAGQPCEYFLGSPARHFSDEPWNQFFTVAVL